MKFIIATCAIIISNFGFSQNRIVKFKVVQKQNIPMPGVNILVKNSNPVIGTQTDLSGNAELKVPNDSVAIILSFLAPNEPKFEIDKLVDSVSINLVKKNAIYYSKSKRLKKVSLKY